MTVEMATNSPPTAVSRGHLSVRTCQAVDMASLTDRIRRRWPRRPLAIDTERSALERRTIDSIQAATFRYTYKGYPFIKNPFEIALYTRLLDRERPRTIVEIGSAGGGGAVWLASQMSALGVDVKVISVDILRQRNVKEPNVRFIRGDVHQLGASTLPALLDDAERPFLVIDDGPHVRRRARVARVLPW